MRGVATRRLAAAVSFASAFAAPAFARGQRPAGGAETDARSPPDVSSPQPAPPDCQVEGRLAPPERAEPCPPAETFAREVEARTPKVRLGARGGPPGADRAFRVRLDRSGAGTRGTLTFEEQ